MASRTFDGSGRWKVRALWVGAVTYFLIFLNGLRYWGQVPLIIEILGTLLNLAIVTFLVTSIRKAYKSHGNRVVDDSNTQSSSVASDADRRKIRFVWFLSVLYFILVVIAISQAAKLPYQVFVLCAVLNFAVIIAFIITLRKLYLKSRRN